MTLTIDFSHLSGEASLTSPSSTESSIIQAPLLPKEPSFVGWTSLSRMENVMLSRRHGTSNQSQSLITSSEFAFTIAKTFQWKMLKAPQMFLSKPGSTRMTKRKRTLTGGAPTALPVSTTVSSLTLGHQPTVNRRLRPTN